jgi:threonine synthase
MKYRSTRGESSVCGFEEAVLNGLADDKGLYVPDVTPQITLEEIREVSLEKNTYVCFKQIYRWGR